VNALSEMILTFTSQYNTRFLNTTIWYGENDFGYDLNTEIYFYRLKSENIDNSIKLLYVK
tara:strand:- start:450 stop:629 length:180 start_codon:yes stop_codon:yes gene_type:complete